MSSPIAQPETRYATPFAVLGIFTGDGFVTGVRYLPRHTALRDPHDRIAERACREVERYLDDPGRVFDLPYRLDGTPFQRRVWREIAAIPLGQSRSYGEIARELGSAARPVGQACGANPVPIVIPCHRVVAASRGLNGGLDGFAHARDGFLLDVKRWLRGSNPLGDAKQKSGFMGITP